MILILLIDLVVIGVILTTALSRGLEQALPSFTFFATLIPMQESQIELPGLFGLTGQRIALILLLVLYLTLRKKTKTPTLPLKFIILAHIAWVSLSTLESIVFSISLKQLLAQIVEYYLLYYIFTKTISQTRTIHKILFAMVAAMFVCCIFGTIERYSAWSVLSLFPKELWSVESGLVVVDDRGLRIRSTFPHAIHFGDALALTIPLALYLLTVTKSRPQRALLWVGTVLMFGNIYRTGSRGAWIALLASLAVLFLGLQSRMRRYLLFIGVLSLSVLITNPGVWQTIESDYNRTFDPDAPMGTSYEYRYALSHVIRDALAKNTTRAIWGYGLGACRYVGIEGEFQGRSWIFRSCDSSWLEMMYETGYIGFLILGVLLLKPVLIAFADFRKLPKPERDVNFILAVALGSFCLMMTSVALYGWGQNGYMLWVLIAASVTYSKLKRSEIMLAPAPLNLGEASSLTTTVGPAVPFRVVGLAHQCVRRGLVSTIRNPTDG